VNKDKVFKRAGQGNNFHVEYKMALFCVYCYAQIILKALYRQAMPPHIQALISYLDIQAVVSSTNDVVSQQLQQQKKSGMVCIAEMQQSGRGRRGRTWLSPPAGTFYGSVGWVFNEGFQVLEGLSLAVGVAD
jgi:BirA family biotin operon repressor/biotin-[acetyl-CoA-carboxylase] ligase